MIRVEIPGSRMDAAVTREDRWHLESG